MLNKKLVLAFLLSFLCFPSFAAGSWTENFEKSYLSAAGASADSADSNISVFLDKITKLQKMFPYQFHIEKEEYLENMKNLVRENILEHFGYGYLSNFQDRYSYVAEQKRELLKLYDQLDSLLLKNNFLANKFFILGGQDLTQFPEFEIEIIKNVLARFDFPEGTRFVWGNRYEQGQVSYLPVFLTEGLLMVVDVRDHSISFYSEAVKKGGYLKYRQRLPQQELN